MVTGDYHHTAVAVAKDVGMFRPDSQVVVIDTTRHELQRDARLPGTPDSGSSSEAPPHPQATPKGSMEARKADFPHGFCGAAQAECPQDEAMPRGLSPVDSLAEKGGKQPYSVAHVEGESWQSSQRAASSRDSPIVVDRPLANRCSVLADEAGKKVSFEVPSEVPTLPISTAGLPFEMSSSRRPPADPIPSVEPGPIKTPLARHPSKAASASALLATKGKAQHPLSRARRPPSRLCLEGPPPLRQLSRVSSLTRLPNSVTAHSLAPRNFRRLGRRFVLQQAAFSPAQARPELQQPPPPVLGSQAVHALQAIPSRELSSPALDFIRL